MSHQNWCWLCMHELLLCLLLPLLLMCPVCPFHNFCPDIATTAFLDMHHFPQVTFRYTSMFTDQMLSVDIGKEGHFRLVKVVEG